MDCQLLFSNYRFFQFNSFFLSIAIFHIVIFFTLIRKSLVRLFTFSFVLIDSRNWMSTGEWQVIFMLKLEKTRGPYWIEYDEGKGGKTIRLMHGIISLRVTRRYETAF